MVHTGNTLGEETGIGSPRFNLNRSKTMKSKILILALGLIASPVFAADLPVKAPAYQYPTSKCGLYYGVDTGGSTGAVANSVAGTQMTQGYVGLTVGWTCPAGVVGFWYVDGDFDFYNINGGTTQGMSLFSGPVLLKQRFGFGIPINEIIAAIPGLTALQAALPALPLPIGQSVVTAKPSIYLATTWDDVGAKFGLQNFQTVEFGLDVGLSVKTRITDGIVLEPYVEYLIPSTAKCIGTAIVGGCVKETNRTMAGVKWLF
jgi:hypothetical protein